MTIGLLLFMVQNDTTLNSVPQKLGLKHASASIFTSTDLRLE